jgi:hypothetical protein
VTWHQHANCRGRTDLMYDRYRWTEARQLCDTCTVAADCLADAVWWEAGSLDVGQRHGMWAGSTPSERIQLTRRRRAVQRDAVAAARALRTRPAEEQTG